MHYSNNERCCCHGCAVLNSSGRLCPYLDRFQKVIRARSRSTENWSERFFARVFCRLRAGTDVQRRERAGEPPPGRGLQTTAGGQLRHLRQPHQEAATVAAQDGHRHGPRHRHVQAHESPGRPQDHGGDQEGGRLWGASPRQLHRPHSGV